MGQEVEPLKPKKEAVDQYRQMAQDIPENVMDIIREHLRENCPKFDEAHFDGCMEYLQETFLEMLGGRESARKGKLSGAVHADVVFKICRDYFDDELWKAEQESDKERKAKVAEMIDDAKSDAKRAKSPKRIAWNKEYSQRPEVRERRRLRDRERNKTPERKAYMRERDRRRRAAKKLENK